MEFNQKPFLFFRQQTPFTEQFLLANSEHKKYPKLNSKKNITGVNYKNGMKPYILTSGAKVHYVIGQNSFADISPAAVISLFLI